MFLSLRKTLWPYSEVNLRKPHIYRAAIRTIFAYAWKVWPIRINDAKRLESFDHWCLHKMAEIKWHDRIRDAAVSTLYQCRTAFVVFPKTSHTVVRRCSSPIGDRINKEKPFAATFPGLEMLPWWPIEDVC